MTTWTLWIGALLVVGGSAAHLKHQAVAARGLWVLAVLAFVTTAASAMTATTVSLPLVITLVVAIAGTVALVAVTREQATKAPAARRGAQ
ncbi:hypothetical protein Rhow_000664 [Rhodococcus wratislaviensis]|uniref:Uncharacterized protein n=1 Tax=Rhodococcus wratislaviensis TaxID=44752 RepID=A0A402C2L1_RHOWR|nr:hypothetical protein [Rhodococcus wratislaviensis]GCE37818.1 hypothetical protein Rhow_000664 [Rhodococcus wratislaviensis]